MNPITVFKRSVRKCVSNKLGELLPRKIKRLIYLSSVLAVIDDIKNPNAEITRKLNLILGLSKDDNAIIFPMYVHSFIWGDIIKEHNCEFNSYQIKLKEDCLKPNFSDIVEFFCKNIPTWLSYGSIDLLKRDLNTVFCTMPILLAK